MLTREEEYARVRELLDFPKEQRPSPHLVFGELLRQEQFMLNRLTNTRRAWNVIDGTLSVVAGTDEYAITPAQLVAPPGNPSSGIAGFEKFSKPFYVAKRLDATTMIPIPFTDIASEGYNPSYSFMTLPSDLNVMPEYQAIKASFYRNEQNRLMVRLYPVPDEPYTLYILGVQGVNDWTDTDTTLWKNVSLPEHSDYRTVATALFLLPKCEWEGHTRQESSQKKLELKQVLEPQFAMYREEFETFLRNPQHEPIDDTTYWWY